MHSGHSVRARRLTVPFTGTAGIYCLTSGKTHSSGQLRLRKSAAAVLHFPGFPSLNQSHTVNAAPQSTHVVVSLDADRRIVVRIGDETRIGDSYYLGIDRESPDHNCSPAVGLRRLLQAWIRELSSDNGDLIYLPFDFSDEYTRWLACQKIADQILVVFGWAEVEGWAISPSDFSQFARAVPEFNPDEPLHVQQFYLPRFLSQLRQSLANCPHDP